MIYGTLDVSKFIPADHTGDVSRILQKAIDENPNRTLFFPDGEYPLDRPLRTPAEPAKSVSLRLSDYAVVRATERFEEGQALIRLGADFPANDIRTPGSVYGLCGGILDGSGRADGVSIDGGRETVIRNVSIKNTRTGLHIRFGANNGSSDADITNVNIVGNRTKEAIGVLAEGFDNTFTNMRIADVYQGVVIRSAGNILRSIHPLFTLDFADFEGSRGFCDERGTNWYNVCYSDNFYYGYDEKNDIQSVYDSCYCMWYSPLGTRHTAFHTEKKFRSMVTNFKIGFKEGQSNNIILDAGEEGGAGVFDRIITPLHLVSDHAHEEYLRGGMFHKGKDLF